MALQDIKGGLKKKSATFHNFARWRSGTTVVSSRTSDSVVASLSPTRLLILLYLFIYLLTVYIFRYGLFLFCDVCPCLFKF